MYVDCMHQPAFVYGIVRLCALPVYGLEESFCEDFGGPLHMLRRTSHDATARESVRASITTEVLKLLLSSIVRMVEYSHSFFCVLRSFLCVVQRIDGCYGRNSAWRGGEGGDYGAYVRDFLSSFRMKE